MSQFEESLASLNSAQRQAVDQIDGPVMVIAGPGTGKTQLLSMRVANILDKTDTNPSSILCLTFTNKAAVNMRQRIIELTGGSAKAVNVKTFHSFAMEIMNIYPEYFWNGAELITAPEASQLEIITGILKKLPFDNPLSLKFAGKFTSDKKVKQALKLVKEAGLRPDQLKSIVDANIAYIDIIEEQLCDILGQTLSLKKLDDLLTQIEELPDQGISSTVLPVQDMGQIIKSKFRHSVMLDKQVGKTVNTGNLKKKLRTVVSGKPQMLRERKTNDWWMKLAEVYQSYRNQLHSRGYYDHSDMIIEVITALREYPDLKAVAQEKYLYVLIDEFQDTNAAQLQLAHLIADHPSANGNPNLMVVGDDDQTIYKFNGADLNNMLSFEKSYPKTKKIVLTENYRSSQKIIDAAEKIIENSEDRLVVRDPSITKKLSSNIEPKQTEVDSWLFQTDAEQLYEVCRDIQSQLTNNPDKTIAVLARNHLSLQRTAKLLDDLNISINYELKNNIFDLEIIQLVHKVAGLLVSINNGNIRQTNFLLSDVIKHPAWGIPPRRLWQIAIDNYQQANWLEYLLQDDPAKPDSLKPLGEWLLWLASETKRQPLPVIMEYIIGMRDSPEGQSYSSPIRSYFLSEDRDTDYLRALSALNSLYRLTSEFCRLHTASLEDFYQYINVAIENHLIVSDDLTFTSSKPAQLAVQLLTIHKAKGLEFDRVYVIDALDKIWRPKAGSTYTPINLPLQPVFDDQDDYARLMYVAATRAKTDLIFSSYSKDATDKEVLTTPLIYNVADQIDKQLPADTNFTELAEQSIAWPSLNNQSMTDLLSPKVENYSLSASALLSFLDLSYGGPKTFVENYLLRLPQAQTESEAFGSAIHKALEIAQIQYNTDGIDKKSIIEAFNSNLTQQFMPFEEYVRYQAKGQQLLEQLLTSPEFKLPENGRPELSLDNVRLSGATIKGKLDNLFVEDDRLTIIDYKTGGPLSSLNTKDQTKAIKAWRHKTQLTFYCLLVENSGQFKPQIEMVGQMYYLEAEKPTDIIKTYQPSQEDSDRLAKLANIVWTKIKNLDFPNVDHYTTDYAGIEQFQQDLLDGKI